MDTEEKEETRHKEFLDLTERRMKIEQARAEMAGETLLGLVDAVDKLAKSVSRAR